MVKLIAIVFSLSFFFALESVFGFNALPCGKNRNRFCLDATRRDIFHATGASVAAIIASAYAGPANAEASAEKILVLGGTGFVGSQVCKKLESMGINFAATSRDGRDGTIALDFLKDENVTEKVEALSKGFTAVISAVGAIGTSSDLTVNKGTGLAAMGAKASGVKRFVYISVAPEVRESATGISFLTDYLAGKKFTEDIIRTSNFDSYTIISPTFIYGGDTFALNPPRVAEGYGKIVESVLSSDLFRQAAAISPGIIKVALEPPVNVSTVAEAAIASSLGRSSSILDTYDKIKSASDLI